MPTLKDYSDTDELHNPSSERARQLVDMEKQTGQDAGVNAGLDQLSAYANDPANASGNIQATNLAEQQAPDVANKYNWDGGAAGAGAGATAPKSIPARILGFGKKNGAGIGIGGGALGLFGLFMTLSAPFMIFQQMIATFTSEFNDEVSAMDIRSPILLKKKYASDITNGKCNIVKIACRYKTMRTESGLAKRLKAAGIEIEADRSIMPGRMKPKAFIFDGKRIEAKNLIKEASKDPRLRAAIRKGYDPIFAATSDKLAASVRTKLGLKRSSSVEPSSDKEKMNEDLKKVAARTDELPADGKPLTQNDDGTYSDEDGNTYPKESGERVNNVLKENVGRANLAEKVTKSAVKSSVKGALLVTAMGAGAVDGLCSAWVMIRVAGFAAKYYQQRQLISYYFEFAKIAHKQKFGDLTPDEMTFFADKLTSTNSEGKSALDSAGYRFAAYGDTFSPGSFATTTEKSDKAKEESASKIMIQNETSRYVNGQILNDNMMSKLVGAIQNNEGSTAVKAADKTCKFTKSWKGQALVFAAAIVGVGVAILTGGFSLGAGVVLQAGASVAISVAMALIQPKLIDMVKGEVIKGDENGNETGNALASGGGGYNAQTSQRRGLRPASNEAYAAFTQKADEIAALRAEEERATTSPFDATNPNTFLGSIVSQLLPYFSKQQSIGMAGVGAMSFVGNSFASLAGSASTAQAEGEKYQQCDDPEYEDLDMAADPFCNLRYAATYVDKDSDEVLEYMLKGGPNGAYITDEDPTPQGDYKDYVAKCINRESSIGDDQTDYTDGTSEGNGYDGKECVIGQAGENEYRNAMFSLFYIDSSINDGMENDFDDGTSTASAEGAEFKAATFNILHEPDNFGDCDWKCRLERSVTTLKDNDIDIAGLQEARPDQQKLLRAAKYGGDTYDIYPQNATNGQGPNENPDSAVIWDKSKFSLVQGRQKSIQYEGGNRKVNIVKLKYIEGGADGPQLYVLNTHDPTDSRAGGDASAAQNRYNNTVMYVDLIKNELSDAPVMFTGDFNSRMSIIDQGNQPLDGKRENLAYCVLTRDSLLAHISDIQEGKSGECPSDKDVLGRNDVDHIFVSPTIEASGYGIAKRGENGGDHDMVYADLKIPGGAASTGAGSTFVIGTYNQKRSLSESQHENATKNITDNGMDVVGTQETSNPKYGRYKSYLAEKNYGVYPTHAGPNQTCSNAQAIFYNKGKFKLVQGEYFEIPRYPDPAVDCGGDGEKTTASHSETGLPKVWTHIPVVWLQDTGTGQTVIVVNVHNVANVQSAAGTQPSKSRFRSAQIIVEKIKELKTENPGVPIFLTGDFNEGTNVRNSANVTYQGKQSNLLFCMFAENGLMKSAAGPAMKCDPKYGIGTVDYIYTTPEVKIDWTKEIANGGSGSGPPSYTDHPVRYAQVTVPGDGGTGSTPGGEVAGDDYAKECGKYLSSGDCTGQCVGFVKFRLVKHGVIKLSDIPDGFGTGGNVTNVLRGLGFKVDTTPAVNSVMSLRHNSVGHTAMVSKVNADGSIVVEEYNWPGGQVYGSRTISKDALDRYRTLKIISFAHTETKYK